MIEYDLIISLVEQKDRKDKSKEMLSAMIKERFIFLA